MISPSDADHKLAALHDNFIAEFTVEGLSEPEAIYLSVCRFQMEAHNGGIKQFFTNSSGIFTPYLSGAFTRIGADEMSARLSLLFRSAARTSIGMTIKPAGSTCSYSAKTN